MDREHEDEREDEAEDEQDEQAADDGTEQAAGGPASLSGGSESDSGRPQGKLARGAGAAPPARAKKFTDRDDVQLLAQILADKPFASGKGGLMKAWDATAEKVVACPGFSKPGLTGKSAQAHYNNLMTVHRSGVYDWKRAGGTAETKEKMRLLDTLVRVESDASAGAGPAKRRRIDGALMRGRTPGQDADEAVAQGMRARGSAAADMGSAALLTLLPREPDLYTLIREERERDRQAQAEAQRLAREERRRERAEDQAERAAARAMQLELSRLENERIDKILRLARLNARANSSA